MKTPASFDRVKSGSRHRRQVIWQIIFPVVLAAAGGIFLIVLLSLSTIAGSTASAQWASIATIWLIIPLLVAGVLVALTLAGLIFLIARLTQKLPTFTHLIHTYLQIINIRVGILLDHLVQPQIKFLGRWAGVKSVGKSLRRIGERH